MSDIIKFEQYKIYLEDALNVAVRRDTHSFVMLCACTAISVYCAAHVPTETVNDKLVYSSLAATGFALCVIWDSYLRSCCKLSWAKFEVVLEMEKSLPYTPYTTEWPRLLKLGYIPLTILDRWIPRMFLIFFFWLGVVCWV